MAKRKTITQTEKVFTNPDEFWAAVGKPPAKIGLSLAATAISHIEHGLVSCDEAERPVMLSSLVQLGEALAKLAKGMAPAEGKAPATPVNDKTGELAEAIDDMDSLLSELSRTEFEATADEVYQRLQAAFEALFGKSPTKYLNELAVAGEKATPKKAVAKKATPKKAAK